MSDTPKKPAKKKAQKFMPESRLRDIFGANPDAYFSSARVAAADRAMRSALEGLESSVLKRLEHAVEVGRMQLPKMVPGTLAPRQIDTLQEQAFVIKSHAGMYGYSLANDFAHHLYYYCRGLEEKPLPANVVKVLEAYLNALALIFREKLRGTRSPIAQELLKELDRLAGA